MMDAVANIRGMAEANTIETICRGLGTLDAIGQEVKHAQTDMKHNLVRLCVESDRLDLLAPRMNYIAREFCTG